jgi:hypothetical protein
LHKQQTGHNESLVNSLELVLGAGSLRGRLDRLRARLQPMFSSLPKNNGHFLSHAAARYALHRVIVEMHGWSIAGLEPNATTFNTTSLVGSGILRDIVPGNIESIFEGAVGSNGFTLHDLSVLASTVEHLVHDHQREILRRVCELFDLPTVGIMGDEDMRKIILLYKAVFLIGAGDEQVDLDRFTAVAARKLLREAPRKYPGWEDTVVFVDDEIESYMFNIRSQTNPFRIRTASLEMASRVVEQAADHFAPHLAELECQEIREDLLSFETGDTGRIRLVDFYRAGLTSRFFYVETKEYLRALGALDESDLLHGPKVIVSNYVLSKVNCLAHSNSYSICCINECDHLYGQLEKASSGHASTPDRIASIVAVVSSSTVQAPRNLSQALLHRLHEVAASNGGDVLLHSRLFAQWMHQAFPRECPYPHLTGTTTSLSPMAWSQHHKTEYRIDHVPGTRMKVVNMTIDSLDREFALKQGGLGTNDENVEDLMWTLDEETFVLPAPSMSRQLISMARGWAGSVGMLAALVGMLLAGYTKARVFISSNTHARVDCVFV